VSLLGHAVAEGAGAKFEDDVHHFVLFSAWGEGYL
jgi:hypothetical protein